MTDLLLKNKKIFNDEIHEYIYNEDASFILGGDINEGYFDNVNTKIIDEKEKEEEEKEDDDFDVDDDQISEEESNNDNENVSS